MSAMENGFIILTPDWAEIFRTLHSLYWFYKQSHWEYMDPIDY